MEEIEVVNLQANKQNRQLSLLAFKSPVGNKTRATAPYTKYYLDPKPVALAEDYLEQRSGVARDRYDMIHLAKASCSEDKELSFWLSLRVGSGVPSPSPVPCLCTMKVPRREDGSSGRWQKRRSISIVVGGMGWVVWQDLMELLFSGSRDSRAV